MQPANSNLPISVKLMTVPESVGLLSDILNMTSNFIEDTKAFERMKEMDETVNELQILSKFLRRGIHNPEEVDYYDYPYKQGMFSFVEDSLTAIDKHIKNMNEIKEHKGKIVNFIDKVSLHVAMVEVQSWNKRCKNDPVRTKKYKDKKELALKNVVKFSEKLGITNVSTATVDLTIGQKNPECPAFLEEFIESYTVWKDQQLDAVKEAQTAPQKVAIPQIKVPQIGHR